MPQPKAPENRRAYLIAASVAEAEGDLALAGHLKALSISSPAAEAPDTEVQRLNAEIRAAENVGHFGKSRELKAQLLEYIRRAPNRNGHG